MTVVRYIDPDSDFHRLTRFLETYVNEEELLGGRLRLRREVSEQFVELTNDLSGFMSSAT